MAAAQDDVAVGTPERPMPAGNAGMRGAFDKTGVFGDVDQRPPQLAPDLNIQRVQFNASRNKTYEDSQREFACLNRPIPRPNQGVHAD